MDLTPLEHAAATVSAQLIVGACMGNWWLGGVLACCWFIAREHTQAEYRWIERFGQGLRANMPGWGGFDPRAWTWASVLDWAAPMLACAALGLFLA